MAGEPQTLVVHGVWGDELARLVSERQKGAKLDQLATVVARRTGQREALFVVCHEPYEGDDQPQVTRVVTLGRTKSAAVIRVDAKAFTDYAAIAFGPQPEGRRAYPYCPRRTAAFFCLQELRICADHERRIGDLAG